LFRCDFDAAVGANLCFDNRSGFHITEFHRQLNLLLLMSFTT